MNVAFINLEGCSDAFWYPNQVDELNEVIHPCLKIKKAWGEVPKYYHHRLQKKNHDLLKIPNREGWN